MFSQILPTLTLLAVIGSGLMAGLFFAFSNSVMASLGKLPPPQGIAAMNTINVVIQNPLFLAIFMGTALVALVLGLIALFGNDTPRPTFLLVGALLYLLGNIAVTIAINVPMNDALAAADPASAAGTSLWTNYLDRWVFWNHVRTLACTAALAAFALAMAR